MLRARSTLRAIIGYLSIRFLSLADVFLLESSGVPTGGPLSSYLLNLVLNYKEHKFDQKAPRRFKRFGTCRYADGIALLSRCLCTACLEKVILQTYRGTMPFSKSGSPRILSKDLLAHPFLDCEVYFSFDSLEVAMIHKSEAYPFLGLVTHRAKQSTCLTHLLAQLAFCHCARKPEANLFDGVDLSSLFGILFVSLSRNCCYTSELATHSVP